MVVVLTISASVIVGLIPDQVSFFLCQKCAEKVVTDGFWSLYSRYVYIYIYIYIYEV